MKIRIWNIMDKQTIWTERGSIVRTSKHPTLIVTATKGERPCVCNEIITKANLANTTHPHTHTHMHKQTKPTNEFWLYYWTGGQRIFGKAKGLQPIRRWAARAEQSRERVCVLHERKGDSTQRHSSKNIYKCRFARMTVQQTIHTPGHKVDVVASWLLGKELEWIDRQTGNRRSNLNLIF